MARVAPASGSLAEAPAAAASNNDGGPAAAPANTDAEVSPASGSVTKCPRNVKIGLIICCGCCCLGTGGIISLILFYALKVTLLGGVPSSCYETRPSIQDHPPIEIHRATTADNIELVLWRVPGNVSRPVLIQHGLECSSRDWFAGLGRDALPWSLWREGFDVWLGNNRGNFASMTDKWDWTFEQMAEYDMPTMVNKVLAVSGASSLAYIGHSQGALQAVIHFSKNATTANKISHFVGLAPAVFLTQQRFLWTILSGVHVDDIVSLASARSGNSFQTYEEIMRDRCYWQSWLGLCWRCMRDMGGSFMEGTTGFAPECHDKFECIPAGTSSDNIRAFADGLRAGSFQQYLTDLGRGINFAALQMPITFAVGDQDLFMKPADVERLRSSCPGAAGTSVWVLEGAGHMDMVWGTEAPRRIYMPLIQRLKR